MENNCCKLYTTFWTMLPSPQTISHFPWPKGLSLLVLSWLCQRWRSAQSDVDRQQRWHKTLHETSCPTLHVLSLYFWNTESQAMTALVTNEKKNSGIPVWIWGSQLIMDWIRSGYDSYSLCFNFLSLVCSGWLYLTYITTYITSNHEEGYSVKFLTSWWHFPFPCDL